LYIVSAPRVGRKKRGQPWALLRSRFAAFLAGANDFIKKYAALGVSPAGLSD
jgi:hypothetical protein